MPVQQNLPTQILRLTSFPILGAALLFVYQIVLVFRSPTGHDQLWLLFAARRFLSGAELYGPRISETNPPLVIWFSTIPVLLARLIHAPPPFALRLVVLAMIFASVAWCVRILRRTRFETDSIFLVLMGFAILLVESGTGPLDFGQREQLLVILVLPYVLATASGAILRVALAERCALGIAAGLAICFKPQHLVLLIGLELFFALRSRSLRHLIAPEFLSAIVTGALYLLFVRIFTPPYLHDTFPTLLNTYWAFGPYSLSHMLLGREKFMLLAIACITACYFNHAILRDRETPAALVVCSLAAYLAFVWQGTDWNYQHFPCAAFLLLAAVYLALDLFSPTIAALVASPRFTGRSAVAIAGLALVLLCAIVIHSQKPLPFTPKHFESEQMLEPYGPRTTVYIFSTSAEYFPAVFSRDLRWGSRFVHLWMLPAVVQNQQGPNAPTTYKAHFKRLPPETIASLAAIQRTDTTEDLNRWQPSVILVEHCTIHDSCQGLDKRDFDIIPWFLESPQFAEAWSHYKLQRSSSHFDLYTRTP